MIVIGLTGSIATGKSFVARCFAKIGAAVFDADDNVHQLLTYGGAAVKPVRELFPEAYVDGMIDRKTLGKIVFKEAEKRKELEQIMHPLVDNRRKAFLKKSEADKVKVVVLEIPLLFETEGDALCDYVVVTTVDSHTQKKRALERHGMTAEKFEAINRLQMKSSMKVKKADFVIDTGESEFSVFRDVKRIMKEVVDTYAGNYI